MIDVVSIKNRILELAFQGQLIPQNSSDSSVEELVSNLPELSQKRKSLLADCELEEPYAIPSSWRWVKLGVISSYGDTPKKVMTSEVDSSSWILELEDIEAGGKLLKKTRVRDKNSIGEKTSFFAGQVLYSKLRPYLRKVLIPDEDGICTPELVSFDTFGGVNAHYVKFYLISPYVDKVINQRSYGIKMPRVDAAFMVNLSVPLPPIDEQLRIVEKVESIFLVLETINELQNQYVNNCEALKGKLIDAGIRGKLTEQLPEDGNANCLYQNLLDEKKCILRERKGREDKNIRPVGRDVPFEIPSCWKWIRFGEIGLFKKGPFGSALTKSIFVPKGDNAVKVYEQQHAIQKNPTLGAYYITGGYFDEKMSGFEVKTGDILVSCAGTIGEIYILPDGIEKGIINQALMRITLAESIDKRFFLYFFDSNLKKSAQNESNGSAIKNIPPFDVMKNWYFPLPPLEEQRRIADRIDELLQYCQ